jgi:hypothetical protein
LSNFKKLIDSRRPKPAIEKHWGSKKKNCKTLGII